MINLGLSFLIIFAHLQVLLWLNVVEASECSAGQGLNGTDGVNINIHYGNSTEDPNGQNNNIFNVNPNHCNKGLFANLLNILWL